MDINKISTTTKNVFYLIMMIGSATTAYYKIFENEREIVLLKKELLEEINDLKEDILIDGKIHEHRSDKRYSRALGMGKDHEFRLRKLEEYMNQDKCK